MHLDNLQAFLQRIFLSSVWLVNGTVKTYLYDLWRKNQESLETCPCLEEDHKQLNNASQAQEMDHSRKRKGTYMPLHPQREFHLPTAQSCEKENPPGFPPSGYIRSGLFQRNREVTRTRQLRERDRSWKCCLSKGWPEQTCCRRKSLNHYHGDLGGQNLATPS